MVKKIQLILLFTLVSAGVALFCSSQLWAQDTCQGIYMTGADVEASTGDDLHITYFPCSTTPDLANSCFWVDGVCVPGTVVSPFWIFKGIPSASNTNYVEVQTMGSCFWENATGLPFGGAVLRR
jgi:hypothetical protein